MGNARRLPVFLTFFLLGACSAGQGASEEDGRSRETDSPASAPNPWEQRMLALLEARIETAEDKFLQLAEAIPEDRYDWRPMEGVRSFREVFIHIAADNWAPLWMGVSVPEDIPVTRDVASFRAYQDQQLGKDETLIELRRSFDFLRASLDQTLTRLDERVMVGDREWGIDEMWVALVTHMHEHLGQSIAYARANQIVPPWSR